MRLPYVDNPPKFASSDDQAVVDRVLARRGAMGLITLDLTLLHSPAVTDGWGAFLGAIRTKTKVLPEDLRELAMARVAIINRAWIEWNEHYPRLAATAEWKNGPADKGKAVLQDADSEVQGESLEKQGWSKKQIAVLKYTDAMTNTVTVPDAVFEDLKTECSGADSSQEIVELTATIAAYNCVTRFLVALDVGEANKIDPRTA